MRPQAPINIIVTGQQPGLCRTGIPFAEGELQDSKQLSFSYEGSPVTNFARPLSFWPDGSIKWLHLGFFHHQNHAKTYQLSFKTREETTTAQGIQVQHKSAGIEIVNSQQCFTIDLATLSLSSDKKGELITNLAGELSLERGGPVTARYEQKTIRSAIDVNSGACSAVEIEITGSFDCTSEKLPLKFKTLISIFEAHTFIKLQTTLHNPNAARHPAGLWELGDAGSEEITNYQFRIPLKRTEEYSPEQNLVKSPELSLDNSPEQEIVTYQISPDQALQTAPAEMRITQYASGGQQWQSPVHVDKHNQVPLQKNGYEIRTADQLLEAGDRATPTIYGEKIAVTLEQFWQNFPASIALQNHIAQIDLFPSFNNHQQELQGGEQKTHALWIGLSSDKGALDWVHQPPTARPDTQYLISRQALPYFAESRPGDRINPLIRNGLEHSQNFFTKRETIDEYGWRHFGDLYADHETVGYTGKELFVSHYNNQYDPIYGFLRQYLLTGDARWFELADDLAKHVKDIDIYHTEEDKAEYNGGLFWHTDHYLKAYNATHRSYSSKQAANAYEDRAGGGGPGGQHCYTTGLALHYWLTGEESSKEAVLTLANWVTHFYEGTGTCLELFQGIKIRHTPGLKNPLNGQYPLDRGTANYMVALLDSYQLTQNEVYLQRVEHIIRHTVHPADNIELRNLGNVEECWFYVVFLQAVCRYLLVKETDNCFDESFYYARDALLHYADWMLAYEHPYLDKPEILEFPNDTWTAQDLRKAYVLAAAAHYSATSPQLYREKAQFFEEYVAQTLTGSDQKAFTRILALLMQNHGGLDFYASKQHQALKPRRYNWPRNPHQQEQPLSKAAIIELSKRLQQLSPSKEIAWLKKRLRS